MSFSFGQATTTSGSTFGTTSPAQGSLFGGGDASKAFQSPPDNKPNLFGGAGTNTPAFGSFAFGGKTTATTSNLFSTPATSSTTAFGASKPLNFSFSSAPNQTVGSPGFGAPATQNAAQNLSFGGNNQQQTTAFGSPTTSTQASTGMAFSTPATSGGLAFGKPTSGFSFTTPTSGFSVPQPTATTTNQPAQGTIGSGFGQSAFGSKGFGFNNTAAATTSATVTPAPAFGTSQAQPGLSFGTNITQPQPQTSQNQTGFGFATAQPSAKPETNQTGFFSNQQQSTQFTSQAAPTFGAKLQGFGIPQTTSAPSSQPGGFTNQSSGFQSTGLNLGTSMPNMGTSTGLNINSAMSNAPTLGTSTAGGLNLGSTATTGFNFRTSTASATNLGTAAPTGLNLGATTSMGLNMGTKPLGTTSSGLSLGTTPTGLNLGTAPSTGLNIGTTTSTGLNLGTSTSSGLNMGTSVSGGLNLGTSVSGGLNLGTSTSAGLNLGTSTSAGLKLGTTAPSGLNLGTSTSSGINLGTSTSSGLNLGTSTSSSLNLGTSTGLGFTSTTPSLSLGKTTTTTATSISTITPSGITALGKSTAATMPTLSTATTTVSSAPPAVISSITFAQLEESINKWTLELEEQEKTFIQQATQINAWDRLLIANGEKIVELNEAVETVKNEQQSLEHELDFVLGQQTELEDLLAPLEKQLRDDGDRVRDPEREHMYTLAENLDSQLRQMSEDLKEVIEHLNETNRSQDSNDPIVQIGRILNAHMSSMQWIDNSIAQISTKLDHLKATHDTLRRDNERSFQLTYS